MPTYSYECPLEHTTRIVQHMNDTRPDTVKCDTCGKTAKRVWGRTFQTNFEPYLSHAGEGEPTVVRNAAEERDVEKRHGVHDPGPEEWKRINSYEAMAKRREQRQRAAMASRGDAYEHYQSAEAEVRSMGREYVKALTDRERHEAQQFEREFGRRNGAD